MAVTLEATPPALDDRVELVTVPPGRLKLKAGQRGTVVCDGLPWGLLSIQFGEGAWQRVYQVHPRHLRRVGAGEE